MSTFAKLIPIGNCPSFGDGLIDTVNARDLHKALGVKNNFSNWLIDRLGDCGFQENQDYVSFEEKTSKPGRPSKACFLTLDAAKHFAMLERNDQGFKVRQYFVEFEKQAKKSLPAQTYQELVADTLKANSELIARLGQEIEVRDAEIALEWAEDEWTLHAHAGPAKEWIRDKFERLADELGAGASLSPRTGLHRPTTSTTKFVA